MDSSTAKPSFGYLLSISFASVGLPFLGIGLGGGLIARSGGDPIDAMDVDGMVLFLLMFAIGFAMRLIFWEKSPPALRSLVRAAITAILACSIPFAIWSVILAASLQPGTKDVFIPLYFSVLAAVCQISTIIWLLRYRSEGLR